MTRAEHAGPRGCWTRSRRPPARVRRRAPRGGYTLLELMTIIVVMGALASIAIPNLLVMQFRAKRAEALTNLAGIVTAEEAYEGLYDEFIECEANPSPSLIGKDLQFFDDTIPSWSKLGWRPEGKVRCSYATYNLSASHYRAEVYCDVDSNGIPAIIRYDSSIEVYEDLYPLRF